MKNKGVSRAYGLATGALVLLLIVCAVARVNAQQEGDTAASSSQASSEDPSADAAADPGNPSEEDAASEPSPTESQETDAPTEQSPQSTPSPSTSDEAGAESDNTPVPAETPGNPETTAPSTAAPSELPPSDPESEIRVTIELSNATVTAGDTGFSLTSDVSAHDQNGASVAVKVLSNGGFNINVPGTYHVKYSAQQGADTVTRTRTVQVIPAEDPEDEPIKEDVPRVDPSSAQYQEMWLQRSRIHDRLSEKVHQIEKKLFRGLQDLQLQTDPSAGQLDWSSILAYYVAQSDMRVEQPSDLLKMDSAGLDGLDAIVAAVLKAAITEQAGERTVSLGIRPAEESIEHLGLSETQAKTAQTVMQAQYQKVFETLLDDISYDNLTAEQAQAILAELPSDVSAQRLAVVAQAQSMLGKISYKWGGKYNKLGMNPAWETARKRNAGLDCSGFISWVFINAFDDTSAIAQVGNGSCNQWTRSAPVDWNEAKVGDLIFAAVPGTRKVNHVGVIADIEPDGSYWVIHCTSTQSAQGVVLTEAWDTGFRYIRRPQIYGE